MLNSYFKKDETIYLHSFFNGERYSRKDNFLFVLGLLFGLIAVASLILAFIFTWALLGPFIISGGAAFVILGFFLELNKLHLTKNEKISIEYAITNKRFMYIEKNNKNFIEIPIPHFNSFVVRVTASSNFSPSFNMRLHSFHVPIKVDNDKIQISNDGVVIHDVVDAFLLKQRLDFLLYLHALKSDNIDNPEPFLEPFENIVYTAECQTIHEEQQVYNKSTYVIIIGIMVLFLYIFLNLNYQLDILPSSISFFLIFIFSCLIVNFNSIKSHFVDKDTTSVSVPKTYAYHLKYVITDKRILFFDYNLTLLYAFRFDELEFVNISYYNEADDTGDIYLSNKAYSEYLDENVGVDKGINEYMCFFPPNYFLHKVPFDLNPMDCCKFRLYKVKNPNYVINNFILKHIKQNKNTK